MVLRHANPEMGRSEGVQPVVFYEKLTDEFICEKTTLTPLPGITQTNLFYKCYEMLFGMSPDAQIEIEILFENENPGRK